MVNEIIVVCGVESVGVNVTSKIYPIFAQWFESY